jgi:hypothetical protein
MLNLLFRAIDWASRFADWPWEPLATRHKLGARLLAMIPVTLLPLPAAILTSNGLPNRIFPAEAVEPLATRTACPGWGLWLREVPYEVPASRMPL